MGILSFSASSFILILILILISFRAHCTVEYFALRVSILIHCSGLNFLVFQIPSVLLLLFFFNFVQDTVTIFSITSNPTKTNNGAVEYRAYRKETEHVGRDATISRIEGPEV